MLSLPDGGGPLPSFEDLTLAACPAQHSHRVDWVQSQYRAPVFMQLIPNNNYGSGGMRQTRVR